jgi:hypothetical protein
VGVPSSENALAWREDWTCRRFNLVRYEGHLVGALSHTRRSVSAVFDDPNLVSSAGLVPEVALARSAGLHELAQEHLSVPTDKGANARLKVASLVAGMVAGADSIDDMALAAARWDESGLHTRVCALDVGVVPAGVHLRPRPPARRGRFPVPDQAGQAISVGRRDKRGCELFGGL